jgi:hypothetical protein
VPDVAALSEASASRLRLLIVSSWLLVLACLLLRFRRTRRVDDLAAANIFAAMFDLATFVLLFEKTGDEPCFLNCDGQRLRD